MDLNQLWQAVLGEVELTLSKPNFNTWFRNTFIVSQDGETIIIGVPNAFTKAWFENKYNNIILKALNNILGGNLQKIYYKVELNKLNQNINKQLGPKKNESTESMINLSFNSFKTDERGLNPNYTFNNFVVGKFNELAYAAAQAVCQKPGKAYNPLFIYGSSGLGKTHLIQAIGNEIIKKYPQVKLLYSTCENFTNEFVQAIKNGKSKEFREKYRKLDVFIIDDIQFMSKKEQTQEQFFHTYNDLKQDDRQLIIVSDRAPRAIPSVEQRLLTRLEWGMVADISEPDLEVRMAIIESKIYQRNSKIEINKNVVAYLAENIQNNIRELEGILNRIIAEFELKQINPDMQRVKELVNSVNVRPKRGALTSKQIIEVVTNFFEIEPKEVMGDSRKKELVVPRQIIMYIMREVASFSFPNIGRELGGRDHTTAMHAYDKIRKMIEKDDKTRDDIELIKQKFYEV
jgi:chromosomal replication initiator protein